MLAARIDDKATQDTPIGEDTSSSDDPVEDVDLIEAPEHLHKQIWEMLRTHSAMWDGTFGIADPRILSWWTETELRTDSLHQSYAPLGLPWSF